jgi:hypothetical protein
MSIKDSYVRMLLNQNSEIGLNKKSRQSKTGTHNDTFNSSN